MAIRQIREIGDEILYKKCKKVSKLTDRLKILIEDMIDTMHKENGVGLAAPQVGILKRIMVIEVEEGNPIVFINPVIEEMDGEQVGYEGCLSVPGMTGVVKRPQKVSVRAYDMDMNEFTMEGEDLLARAICHECDHLEGKMYVDIVEGELKTVEEVSSEEELETVEKVSD